MEQELIKISKLKSNTGQIPGLPKNPRKISSEAKDILRLSIIESPEMLEFKKLVVFPFEGNYIVIIGNQRLSICKDMKFKEMPCFILPEDTSVQKLREYSTKDNINSGTFDWKMLNADWDIDLLAEWGLWEKEPSKEDSTQKVEFDAANPKPIIITVEFDSEPAREVLFSRLQNEGFSCWYGKSKPKD